MQYTIHLNQNSYLTIKLKILQSIQFIYHDTFGQVNFIQKVLISWILQIIRMNNYCLHC